MGLKAGLVDVHHRHGGRLRDNRAWVPALELVKLCEAQALQGQRVQQPQA